MEWGGVGLFSGPNPDSFQFEHGYTVHRSKVIDKEGKRMTHKQKNNTIRIYIKTVKNKRTYKRQIESLQYSTIFIF